MTAPQELRKLAEEIASLDLRLALPPERRSMPELTDQWEARLRSALPELSQALGELAVAKEALTNALVRVHASYCMTDVGGGHAPACEEIRAALASELGRLAGEAIEAFIELVESERYYATHKKPQWLAADEDRYDAALERSIQTADALLAACPGLRREVERG